MQVRKEGLLGLLGLASTQGALGAPANRVARSNGHHGGHHGAQPVHFYAATLGGFPPNVDYFNGSSGGASSQIPIPAAGALNLAFTADNRRLLVATGDHAGPNDVVVLNTVPNSAQFNNVVANITINTTINGIPVDTANIVFAHPRTDAVFFAQQDDTGPVALGSFTLCEETGAASNILPITGVDIPGPISTQAAFTRNGNELWWPVPNANTNANGSIVIINTNARSRNYLSATMLDVGTNLFPFGIAISGNKAYVGCQTGPLLVYNVNKRTLLNKVTNGTGGAPDSVVASRAVDRVYADTVGGNVLRAYERGTGNFIDETVLGGVGGSQDMKLIPNETQAYVADTNGNLIQIVDLTKEPAVLIGAFGMHAPANLAIQGPVD